MLGSETSFHCFRRNDHQDNESSTGREEFEKQTIGCEYLQRVRYVKEVIQPQVPLRLPCYDFTPVMNHTVVTVLPAFEKAGLN